MQNKKAIFEKEQISVDVKSAMKMNSKEIKLAILS